MRRLLFIFCFLWFVLVTVHTYAHEELLEHKRSNIEVYGNVQFLLRITPEEKLSINFFESDEEKCHLNSENALKTIKTVLEKNNRYSPPEITSNRFRIDVDYFVSMDEHQYCLVAYEIYIGLNLSRETALADVVEQFYEYENSSPILKINGILYTNPDVLDQTFQKEVGPVTQELLDALVHLQGEISRQTK
ncbi:MAG: hypothetical protein HWE30_11725 [Methylocystaceae bacterium]|nr:hypothetical protein [Methylocystaceae bacterium]